MSTLSFDSSVLQLRVLIWPVLFGFGAYLLLTAQPIGRPKPDLLERLQRLDVDERVRIALESRGARPIFRSHLLEAMLRPLLDDAGQLLGDWLGRVGLGGGQALERKLAIARPEVAAPQFFGEKVLCALVGVAVFPLMDGIGAHPFGVWPVWAWLLGGLLGFIAPDWRLDALIGRRHTSLLMELPTVLDMLCLALSAGLTVEQALMQVAQQSRGAVGQELRRVSRDVTLGQHSLIQALEAMAERADMPEFWSFASHVRMADEQGSPLMQALTTQADTVREAKRLRILAEGGKATVRMLLPVAILILPVLFVVILYPAGVQLLQLAG